MVSESCSIGEIEGSECHNIVHTHGKIGILHVIELSKEDLELVIWRTGICKKMLKTICFHHLKLYIDKFSYLNPFCCDPFGHHFGKKNCKGKEMNKSTIQQFYYLYLPKL